MSAAETIAETLQEIAPLIDAVDVVVQPEDNRWEVGFSDGEIISLVLNEQARSLTFVSRIGPVPEGNRLQTLEAMLLANSMWSTNGGVHMALDVKDQLTLQLHCFAEIDAQTLIAIIEDQREKADVWRKALPDLGKELPADPEDQPDEDGEFLRV